MNKVTYMYVYEKLLFSIFVWKKVLFEIKTFFGNMGRKNFPSLNCSEKSSDSLVRGLKAVLGNFAC